MIQGLFILLLYILIILSIHLKFTNNDLILGGKILSIFHFHIFVCILILTMKTFNGGGGCHFK